jgi:hypothetical protein
MMKIALLLLPLGGLAVALTYGRSLAARVVGVSLALLPGAFSVFMLFVSRRLAELDLHGQPPSDEWLRGAYAMERVIITPVPVVFIVIVALAVILLRRHRDAPRLNDERRT